MHWLGKDTIAGLTACIVMIPSVLAYAELVHLPPITGIYAAIMACVGYAVFSSSRHVIAGPDAAIGLLAGSAILPLAGNDPARIAILAAELAVFSGLILLAASQLKLGIIADLLSRPVLVGYLNGASLVLIATQLGKVFGIRTEGEEIVLNGSPVFLKSISFHEEIPQRMGRAHSEADAVMLLSEAKALGCNMIRLAHYPQNEHIVRLAEKMGFLLWEEIPIWQGIDFANDQTREKAGRMIREMVTRDKNRCALTFWGVANETQPSGPRNAFLRHLIACCREIDDTRQIVAAFDLVRFDRQRQLFVMDDPFIGELDVVAINKYMGWYHPWPLTPDKAVWDVARGKPLIISEFGGEALYGQHGPADVASSWSEEYQEALYRDNLRMFENIPNLRGVSPWILFDFRSPFRFHPANQEGWNRKGLVSDQGYRKKAWYLMKAYYDKH